MVKVITKYIADDCTEYKTASQAISKDLDVAVKVLKGIFEDCTKMEYPHKACVAIIDKCISDDYSNATDILLALEEVVRLVKGCVINEDNEEDL